MTFTVNKDVYIYIYSSAGCTFRPLADHAMVDEIQTYVKTTQPDKIRARCRCSTACYGHAAAGHDSDLAIMLCLSLTGADFRFRFLSSARFPWRLYSSRRKTSARIGLIGLVNKSRELQASIRRMERSYCASLFCRQKFHARIK